MRAAALVRLHSLFAAAAFASALALACTLHFVKVVKNDVAQYPDETFPSVSATIGDWYPERNVFQLLIALTAGPRFALVFLQYFLHHASSPALATLVFGAGIVRTLSCGGWVYITSTDDHDVHDFMMILYMVCNLPWMLGTIAATPPTRVAVIRKRKLIAAGFFASLGPLVYFFIQHKVHRIPGAYTRYAYFEWALIFFDVLYDSIAEQEFAEADLKIYLATNQPDTSTPQEKSPIELPPSVDQPLADALVAALAPAPEHPTTNPFRNVLSFLSDVYLAYIFWTLFTALIPTLFYFSVWKLGLAGHELALLAVLSPALLTLSSPYHYIFANASPTNSPTQPPTATLFTFARTRRGQAILHAAALLGLAAYPVPSPGGRLALVTLATALAVLSQAVAWAGLVPGAPDAAYQGAVLGLGVLLADVLKLANRANNPLWPFVNHKADGWNAPGIALAVLAVGEYAARAVPPASPSPNAAPPVGAAPTPKGTRARFATFRAAAPLGALLFGVHHLLGDASTLIAWSWTGYAARAPRGPLPHVHGALTVGAMALGLAVGLHLPFAHAGGGGRALGPVGAALGAGAAYVVYAYRDWVGYAGGLVEAAFLMALLPAVFAHAARGVGEPGEDAVDAKATDANGEKKTDAKDRKDTLGPRTAAVYTAALGVYCALTLASIFTVAYAFVPGGVYLRERTDLVMFAQTALLILPLLFARSSPQPTAAPAYTYQYKRPALALLVLLPLLALGATTYRLPRTAPAPYRSEARIVRAGIWAVHFGVDNEGHDSQKGMLRLISDMELDVVGLLETDLHRAPFGHRDLTRRIVEEGNYYVDIGPGPNQHTWGCVLLSKFPIISTTHHLLPSPHGELAPAIEAVLDMHGTEVLVLVSHNGQEEDPLDRELQATALAEIMAASTRPVIFLGYVVSKPHEPRPSPYGILVDEGHVHDVDRDDLDRWCEYIFFRGVHRTAYARLSRGIITDTETQLAQFLVPPPGARIDDAPAARYMRSQKELLPEEHWFPMAYYGDERRGGVNGHFYHVFGTPLYYRIPADLPAEGNATQSAADADADDVDARA
ncbi:hypothetical protein HYPSUDRAFT_201775 [Hypholoma sublateritium FD-334 SS-4]|uniref:Protein CWH43 n=1 Tax=Hypholoma sublateritium (strain FD-334 SS-4) TaxID=945553 RepID=A0A0D2L786_HYPSF|nr:hypothetical protein HYPSUDRAFT_201775 [Hypholoma sublateritium FD-334 SS-4]